MASNRSLRVALCFALSLWLLCTLGLAREKPPQLDEPARLAAVRDAERHIEPPPPLKQDGPLLFTFYVLGDSRAGGEKKILFIDVSNNESDSGVMKEMAERIAADIAADRTAHPDLPSFVFHTGDIVRRGDDHGEWEHFRQSIAPLVTRADLGVSLLPVLGNHEYSVEGKLTWREALAEYSATFSGEIDGQPVVKDPALRQLFASPETGRWYHFRCANTEFIVLDSCSGNYGDMGESTPGWPPQLVELRRWLAEIDPNEVRNVFLLQHHPLFSNGAAHPDTGRGAVRVAASGKSYRTCEMDEHILRRRIMQAVFDEFSEAQGHDGAHLRAVFAGHNHTYERIVLPPAVMPGWDQVLDLGGTFLADGGEGERYSDYVRDELRLSTTFSEPVDKGIAFADRQVRFITSGGAGAPHRKKGGLFSDDDLVHRALKLEEKGKLYAAKRFDRWYPDYYRYRFATEPDADYPREVQADRGLDGRFIPIGMTGWVKRLQAVLPEDVAPESPMAILPIGQWVQLYTKKIPNDTEQYHYIKVSVYENRVRMSMFLRYGKQWVIADHDEISTRRAPRP